MRMLRSAVTLLCAWVVLLPSASASEADGLRVTGFPAAVTAPGIAIHDWRMARQMQGNTLLMSFSLDTNGDDLVDTHRFHSFDIVTETWSAELGQLGTTTGDGFAFEVVDALHWLPGGAISAMLMHEVGEEEHIFLYILESGAPAFVRKQVTIDGQLRDMAHAWWATPSGLIGGAWENETGVIEGIVVQAAGDAVVLRGTTIFGPNQADFVTFISGYDPVTNRYSAVRGGMIANDWTLAIYDADDASTTFLDGDAAAPFATRNADADFFLVPAERGPFLSTGDVMLSVEDDTLVDDYSAVWRVGGATIQALPTITVNSYQGVQEPHSFAPEQQEFRLGLAGDVAIVEARAYIPNPGGGDDLLDKDEVVRLPITPAGFGVAQSLRDRYRSPWNGSVLDFYEAELSDAVGKRIIGIGGTGPSWTQGVAVLTPLPTVVISAASSSLAEGAAGTTITITRSGDYIDYPLTVPLAIAGGAVHGSDYALSGATLGTDGAVTVVTIAAGETTTALTVTVTDDADVEGEEQLTIVADPDLLHVSTANLRNRMLVGAGCSVSIATSDQPAGNAPPVLAAIGARSTPMDTALVIELSATDVDGDPLTFGVTGISNGTADVVGGTLTFTPGSGFIGAAGFTATVSDGQGGSDSEAVVVNVTGSGIDGEQLAYVPVDLEGEILAQGHDLTALLGGAGPGDRTCNSELSKSGWFAVAMAREADRTDDLVVLRSPAGVWTLMDGVPDVGAPGEYDLRVNDTGAVVVTFHERGDPLPPLSYRWTGSAWAQVTHGGKPVALWDAEWGGARFGGMRFEADDLTQGAVAALFAGDLATFVDHSARIPGAGSIKLIERFRGDHIAGVDYDHLTDVDSYFIGPATAPSLTEIHGPEDLPDFIDNEIRVYGVTLAGEAVVSFYGSHVPDGGERIESYRVAGTTMQRILPATGFTTGYAVLGTEIEGVADDGTLVGNGVARSSPGVEEHRPILVPAGTQQARAIGLVGATGISAWGASGLAGDGTISLNQQAMLAIPVPEVALSVDNSAITEGGPDRTLTVTRSGPRLLPLEVTLVLPARLSVAGGATITIPIGQPSQGVALSVVDDAIVGNHAVVQVSLAVPASGDATSYHVVDAEAAEVAIAITSDDANTTPVLATIATQVVAEDATVDVDLSATDADGDALVFSTSAPVNGAISAVDADTVRFTPTPGFHGAASFTVTVADGQGGSDSQLVAVTVTPVDDGPAVNQTAPVLSGAVGVGNEFTATPGTWSDPDADALTFTYRFLSASDAAGADEAEVQAASAVATHAAQAGGRWLAVEVIADDGTGASLPARSPWVRATNALPVATAGLVGAGSEDGSAVVVSLAGSDADGDALTFALAAPLAIGDGVASLVGDQLSVAPATDRNGAIEVQFTVDDGFGTSAAATVTVTIAAVNDPPVNDALPTLAMVGADAHATDGTWNDERDGDTGAIGYAYAWYADSAGSGAGTVIPGATAAILAGATAHPWVRVEVTATDAGAPGTASAVASSAWLKTMNQLPVLTPDSGVLAVTEDVASPDAMDLLAADPDGDDALIVWSVQGNDAAKGTVALTTTGASATIGYTPAANAVGSDSVVLRATDADGGYSELTVAVTIAPVNDAPSFTPGAALIVAEDSGAYSQPWATALSAGPSDEAGQALDFLVAVDPPGLVLFSVPPAISPAGVLTFTPAADRSGVATLTIRIHDDGGVADGGVDTSLGAIRTITITADNDAPSFTTPLATVTVAEDSAAYGAAFVSGISVGPADEAAQVPAFSVSLAPADQARFSVQPAIAADGTLSFTPAADANGDVDIAVTLSDGAGGSFGPVAATIAITPVNDAPVNTVAPAVVMSGDLASASAGTWNDDRDLNPGVIIHGYEWFAAAVGSGEGTAIPGASASTFDNAADQHLWLRVVVTATDGGAPGTAQASATSAWTKAANALPTVGASSAGPYTVLEDAPMAAIVTLTVADPDGDAALATWSIVDPPGQGTATLSATSGTAIAVRFRPSANLNGADSLVVRATDAAGGTVDTPIAIAITPVNDRPFFLAGSGVVLAAGGSATLTGWASAVSDPEGDALGFACVVASTSAPGVVASATATVVGSAGDLAVTGGVAGSAVLDVTLSDGNGGVLVRSVQVTVLAADGDHLAASGPAQVVVASWSGGSPTSVAIPLQVVWTGTGGWTLGASVPVEPGGGGTTIADPAGDVVVFHPDEGFTGQVLLSITVSAGAESVVVPVEVLVTAPVVVTVDAYAGEVPDGTVGEVEIDPDPQPMVPLGVPAGGEPVTLASLGLIDRPVVTFDALSGEWRTIDPNEALDPYTAYWVEPGDGFALPAIDAAPVSVIRKRLQTGWNSLAVPIEDSTTIAWSLGTSGGTHPLIEISGVADPLTLEAAFNNGYIEHIAWQLDLAGYVPVVAAEVVAKPTPHVSELRAGKSYLFRVLPHPDLQGATVTLILTTIPMTGG